MALTDYAEDRLDTDAELREDGAPVVLSRNVGGTVVGGTGQYVPGTEITIPTHALLKAYKSHEIDGTNVLRTDTKCMLSAEAVFRQNVVPAVGDMLTVSGLGKKFRVMDVQPLAPGGIAVFYWLQLRTA